VDLKEMFELYGEIKSARFVTDKITRRNKGFGFVEMPNKIEALETIQALNGVRIKGKQISVQEAEERPSNNSYRSYNTRFNN
jgi:cold-inducible RNA-binding protein